MVIVATKKDGTKVSLRDKIAQIDNDTDFRTYVLGFSDEVLPQIVEIKYEQHPVNFTYKHPCSQQRRH